MKASDLKIQELITFDEGRLHLHERRLVLHDLHAMAQFEKDVRDMVGPDHARRLLTRFGYFWGQADAAAMKRLFEWDSLREWLLAGTRLQSLEGAARPVLREFHLDESKGQYHVEVVWHGSGEAEEYPHFMDAATQPVCFINTGYASGYASFCLERPVYFIETQCMAKGDMVCAATGRDLESWGDAITPHLPYFQAEDIQGRVRKLTEALRRRTQEVARARRRLGALEAAPGGTKSPFLLEIRSRKFQRIADLATRIAPYDSSVLITGETGVGKEVMARYIHHHSRRSKGPFVGVNCGALPETLLESELFGHARGAFTGAVSDRMGLFEQASKGTLFLDEIGDVSPALQTKLLRVLQEREIMRVGESRSRKVDVRIVSATNRNLPRDIQEERFREDLFYRLAVIEIEIPPLRERIEDILPLARFFTEKFGKVLGRPELHLDATCLDLLQEHPWPGNVRELENAIEHAAVLCREGKILPENLPPAVARRLPTLIQTPVPGEPGAGWFQAEGTASAPKPLTLQEVERQQIAAVLKHAQGNRKQTAALLGIGQATLWRKIRLYGLA